MTIEPNMFLQQALSGKAQMVSDPANTFVNQVCLILGATVDALVSPAVTNQTGLFHISIPIPDAATQTLNYKVLDACEVVDVIVRKSGAGAANTIQILNNVTAMSDAIAAAVDKTITRAGTLDPAQTTLAAGGTVGVTATRAAGSMLANVTLVVRRR